MSALRFDEVDSNDPTSCIAYLDMASSLDGVKLYKRQAEPRRFCRRPFRLSHAAMAASLNWA